VHTLSSSSAGAVERERELTSRPLPKQAHDENGLKLTGDLAVAAENAAIEARRRVPASRSSSSRAITG
jgi:hypothetical protein